MNARKEEIERLAREIEAEAEEEKARTARLAKAEPPKPKQTAASATPMPNDSAPRTHGWPTNTSPAMASRRSMMKWTGSPIFPTRTMNKSERAAASALGVRVVRFGQVRRGSQMRPHRGLGAGTGALARSCCGCRLLDLIADTARDHVVLPDGAAYAIALWVAFAHSHDCWPISPLLAITSPAPECGKTVLLDLLDGLVPKALPACNVTSSVVFRIIEERAPTLLIDEADTFLPDNNELRGILDSGHRRSNAFVLRNVGDHHEPKHFRTWSPKVVALIGKLPPTLYSRSIHIRLRRMLATESVMPLRFDRRGHLVPIKRKLIRWALDNEKASLCRSGHA